MNLRRRLLLIFSFGVQLLLYSDALGLARVHHHHRLQDINLHTKPHYYYSSRQHHTLLYSNNSANNSVSSGENGTPSEIEGTGSESSFRQRFGRYFSAFKIASTAFVAGSMSIFILSMALFHQSFDYNPAVSYQGVADISTTLPTRAKSKPASNEMQQSVALYRSILDTLSRSYVDDINTDEMLETSVDSMLSTLDPYTEYLSQTDLARRQKSVGIGAFVMKSEVNSDTVTLDGKSASKILSQIPSAIPLPRQLLGEEDVKSQYFKVVLSLEGYAYDAGLRVGDELLSIDGQDIIGDLTLENVRELLVGDPGTTVEVQFTRPGVSGVQTVNVERRIAQISSVPCATMLEKSIGYIRLRRFGGDAGESMKAAIRSLQSKASQDTISSPLHSDTALKGLVLDLRDNSGGELVQAIQIASLFVPDHTFLGSSKGEGSMMPNQSYYSGSYPQTTESSLTQNTNQQLIDPDKTHIILLTNKQTASASEFLAGVFQDLDIGVIIGNDKETLGKGIGQRELPLPFGRALKLTYHEFYTVSGRCVSKQRPGHPTQASRVFYTSTGRRINDRRGIQVDVRTTAQRSLLNDLLSSTGAYYQFASEWYARNPSAQVDGINDKIYKEFRAFVSREQQRGHLKLEETFDNKRMLQQIELVSNASNNRKSSLQSVGRLKQQIAKDLLSEFDSPKCRDIIRSELELNLLARVSPDSLLIERSSKTDGLVKEAVKILKSSNSYDTILNKS